MRLLVESGWLIVERGREASCGPASGVEGRFWQSFGNPGPSSFVKLRKALELADRRGSRMEDGGWTRANTPCWRPALLKMAKMYLGKALRIKGGRALSGLVGPLNLKKL